MAYSRECEFVMSFVANSRRYKEQYVDRWREIVENFTVEPYEQYQARTSTDPYRNQDQFYNRGGRAGILLKDPETHKVIWTFAAKLSRALFGDRRREYVQARPVGWEDAPQRAPTTTRVLRYAFSLPGSFRTMVESIVDMLLFGTSVIEVTWKYQEREMPVREVRSQYGIETSETTTVRVPVYDDVLLSCVDVNDFYPDPSRYRIQDMNGVAKRFKMCANEARAMAAAGVYDKAAVERAIAAFGTQNDKESTAYENFREDKDQPRDAYGLSDFKEMIGYEYSGDVPWSTDYVTRKMITILNGETVRNEPYPYADPSLHFHTLIINPIQGRFYGISPAEVIRFDQDFTDAIKSLLATAIVRQVHPPIAYDSESDIDLAKLMRWKADLPIGVRGGPNAIGTLRYDANVLNAFNMAQWLKTGMQDASGAPGGIQGEPGPDREAATVGAARLQFAMDHPELAALILENECLPPIAKSVIRRYQQFTLDTEDLKRRIGELPDPAWIGDIMGDFDVEFIGSRQAISRQMRLQSYDRLVSLITAFPAAAAQVPVESILRNLVGDVMELPEIAAEIGDPQQILKNALLQQAFGGPAGAGNGVAQGPSPAGMLPAQTAGGGTEGVS